MVVSECEDVIVMESGSVLARGPPEDIRTDDQVIEAYFGREEA